MKTGKLSTPWCITLIILPFIAGLICLGIGRIWISPAEVFSAIAEVFTGSSEIPVLTRMTLWNLRLPRILLAAVAGAGLSAAGCAFQSLFANPLATPDTLGVASGAYRTRVSRARKCLRENKEIKRLCVELFGSDYSNVA